VFGACVGVSNCIVDRETAHRSDETRVGHVEATRDHGTRLVATLKYETAETNVVVAACRRLTDDLNCTKDRQGNWTGDGYYPL